MNELRIIRDLDEFHGSCYIEVLPGPYKQKDWNGHSLFFEDDAFAYLEGVISRHEPNYEHHSNTEISRAKWHLILANLQFIQYALRSGAPDSTIAHELRCTEKNGRAYLIKKLEGNRLVLDKFIQEFSDWVRQELTKYDCISVLGI